MIKKWCVISCALLLAMLGASILFTEEVRAVPGPPMVVKGTIKDYAGANITDGIPVCAYIIDPINGNEWFNYSSANGGYGYAYTGVAFNINDTDEGRQDYTVYLHVGQLNVTSFTFNPGLLERNLTIADDPTVLSNNSDTIGYTGDPFEVNVTVREYMDAGDELTVNVSWSHGSLGRNDTMNFTGGSNLNGFYYNASFALDYYSINDLVYTVYVNDTSGNHTSYGPHSVSVTDNDAPEIKNFPSTNPTTGDSYNFTINVTDNTNGAGEPYVYLNYYFTGTWTNASMTYAVSTDRYYKVLSVPSDATILHYNITTNDTYANWNESGDLTLIVIDNDPPEITNNTVTGPTTGDGFTFNATVTDNRDTPDVFVEYWYDSGAHTNVSMAATGFGNYFERTITVRHTTDILFFNILANDSSGNWNQTGTQNFGNVTDDDKPNSSVDTISGYWKNSAPLIITGIAEDNIGVKNVTLYYYNSTDNETFTGPYAFTEVDEDPWVSISWSFDFPKGNGYYLFYSIAADNSTNTEDYTSIDAVCGYDTGDPSSNVDAITTYWHTSNLAITATASDSLSDVAYVNLYYYYSSDNETVEGPTLFGTDSASPWSWDFDFPDGSGHYGFYSRAVDNAANTQGIPGTNDTVCGYDADAPSSHVDAITTYWHTSNLAITATASDTGVSGVASVTLYYQYSDDNLSWSGWMTNETVSSSPYSWSFTFSNGSGYYEFYTRATDNASNVEAAPAHNDTICGYDIDDPVSSVDAISGYWKNTSPLSITATASDNHSGVYSVRLTYRFCEDNSTWPGAWSIFDHDYASPYSWNFDFPDGEGHYQFYTKATDNMDNGEGYSGYDDNCGYDITAPSSAINNRTAGYYSYFQNSSLTITATVNITSEANGSGLSHVRLYYWYHNATTNSTKENYTANWTGSYYGLNGTITYVSDTQANVSWSFNFSNDLGYYRFCSIAYDNLSNAESLLNVNQTNNTECFFNNSAPNTPTRIGPTGSSVSLSAELEWNCTDPDPGDTLSFDVYFGEDPTPNSSELVSNKQPGETYDPDLEYSTDYYWQIVAWDSHNVATAGPIWSFTTRDRPSTTTSTGQVSDDGDDGEDDGGTVIGNPPVADPGGPYEDYLSFEDITFDGSGSTDNGTIEDYSWDFGDGNLGDGVNPMHNYSSGGNYTVTLTVTDNDGLSNSSSTYANITQDTDADGWDDEIEESYGTNTSNSTDYPKDSDGDGIPDDPSPTDPEKYPGDDDDDNDGIDDETERQIGSDPTKEGDASLINIGEKSYYLVDSDGDGKIDSIYNPEYQTSSAIKTMEYDNETYYIFDTNNDGIDDTFYNPETGFSSSIEIDEDGKYKIDINGDGTWDYIYDPVSGLVSIYSEEEGGIPWYLIVAIVVIIIIIFFAILFKTGYLYVEDEPKKPVPPPKKKEETKKTTSKKTKKK